MRRLLEHDFHDARADIAHGLNALERDLHCLIAQCHTPPDDRPATITLTVS